MEVFRGGTTKSLALVSPAAALARKARWEETCDGTKNMDCESLDPVSTTNLPPRWPKLVIAWLIGMGNIYIYIYIHITAYIYSYEYSEFMLNQQTLLGGCRILVNLHHKSNRSLNIGCFNPLRKHPKYYRIIPYLYIYNIHIHISRESKIHLQNLSPMDPSTP